MSQRFAWKRTAAVDIGLTAETICLIDRGHAVRRLPRASRDLGRLVDREINAPTQRVMGSDPMPLLSAFLALRVQRQLT
jgi:hypothetical protein